MQSLALPGAARRPTPAPRPFGRITLGCGIGRARDPWLGQVSFVALHRSERG